MIDVWAHLFRDIPYSEVSRGLEVFAMSNATGFPPDPGQLNKCIRLNSPDNDMTATEAWAVVEKIVRETPWERYQEEYDKLPRNIQRAIGTAASLKEMGMIEESQLSNEKARFIHAYNALVKREEDYMALPERTRAAIESKDRGEIKLLEGQFEQLLK